MSTSLRPSLEVFTDAEALGRAAAERVLRAARSSVRSRGTFRVALAGGTTPVGAYREIARRMAEEGEGAAGWDVWFGDERCVPADDPRSNARTADESLLGALRPAPLVHRVPTHLGSPGEMAAAYATSLAGSGAPVRGGIPVLDLILLGMGPDGHTASLFPDDPALEERRALVVAVRAPKPPADRVTFTLPTIDAAREVLVLVSGQEKAPALAEALRAKGRSRLPVARIRPTDGTLTFLADADAAGGARSG